MKIHTNIPKLQQGGAAPPFVSWSPIPTTPVAPSTEDTTGSSKSSGQNDDGLLSKEMVKLLMEQGLPSDVEAFTKSMNQLYNDPTFRMSGSIDPSLLSSQYLGIISNINKIKYNKELYDSNIKRLTENGGLSDVAISNVGRMVVQNMETGELSQVSPDEYYSNQGLYKAVTNGDLAHLRAINPNLAFNSDIFNVLNNGIGQEDIQKYINLVISDLGKSISSSSEYVSSRGEKLMNGMNQLIDNPRVRAAITSDGVYKISREEESNVEQATAALDYLYSTLPENAKNYIRAKAAINGLDPNEGSRQVLTSLIKSKIDSKNSFKVDYESTLSKDKSEGDGKSTIDVTQDREIWDGFNSPDNTRLYQINTGGTYTFQTPAIVLPALKTYDGTKTVGQSRMDKVIEDSTLSTGYKNSMWFGNKKVDPMDLDRIGFQGGEVVGAYLPVKTLPDGSTKPDLEALKGIEDAEKEIKRSGGRAVVPEKDQREIYKRHEAEDYYGIYDNPRLLVQNGLVRPYYMVNAIAADGGASKIKFGEDNPYVKETNNYDQINAYMNKLISGKDGENEVDNDTFLWFGHGDNIYSGTFFIEASDIRTSQSYLSGINVPKSMNSALNMDLDLRKNDIKLSGY